MTTHTEKKVLWFGREPAWFVTALTAAVVALCALLPIANGLAAAIGGVVTAGGGLVIAFTVLRDGQVAAIVGLFKAAMVVLVLAGMNIDPATQAMVLIAVEAVGVLFIRGAVVAPVDINGYRRGADAPELRRAA
jgi:hypothetical protein